LTIINKILGGNNCSALSIKQLADERYFPATFGKLVNLGDDIEDEFISKEQVKMLKNLSTCDKLSMRRMFENAKDIEPSFSLIFTSNSILKAREKGEAWKRRIDWVPMYPTPKTKDPKLIDKLTTPEALQYWIRLIIEGYKRLYKNERFTYCHKIANFNEEYHLFNDNVNAFLEERPLITDWIGKGKNEAYREYKEWCLENDEHPQGKEKYFSTLLVHFSLAYGKVNIVKKGRNISSTTVLHLPDQKTIEI